MVNFAVTETFECKIDIERHDSVKFDSKVRDAAIFDGKLAVQLSDGTLTSISIEETNMKFGNRTSINVVT